MNQFRKSFQEILRYPSAVAGIVIIILLVITAIVTMISIPYHEAISLWRSGEDVWYKNPKTVPPDWTNWFSREKQPPTIVLNSAEGTAEKTVVVNEKGNNDINIIYTFDYQYDTFPQDLTIFFTAEFDEKQPFASVYWITPAGEEIRVGDFGVDKKGQSFRGRTFRGRTFWGKVEGENAQGLIDLDGAEADPFGVGLGLKGFSQLVEKTD